MAKDSGDPGKCFSQLVLSHNPLFHKINIYANGSRSSSKKGNVNVGC